MDTTEATVDEEVAPNAADVEAAGGRIEEAGTDEETAAPSGGLVGIVTGSYWSSFFLVLIGANTVRRPAVLGRAQSWLTAR
eukprot:COSAG02_NODE_2539_length_8577_cov_5.213730_1_plen_81_part_00